jgi:hypothetical protein
MVQNWEEVRIKGKFVQVQDAQDKDSESVLSKWYYSVQVPKDMKMMVGIHQEDFKIQGTTFNRNYMDLSLLILRKNPDGTFQEKYHYVNYTKQR